MQESRGQLELSFLETKDPDQPAVRLTKDPSHSIDLKAQRDLVAEFRDAATRGQGGPCRN
jgi:hypothetical protein